MAYIHKNNFNIQQNLDSPFNANDYFEVDDMIALPVARLNRIGYTTIGSSAGRPFPCVYNMDSCVINSSLVFDDFAGSQQPDVSVDQVVRFQYRSYAERISYITFKDPLPDNTALPEGWFYDIEENRLLTRYTKKADPYQFVEAQIKKMRALIKWVNELRPEQI